MYLCGKSVQNRKALIPLRRIVEYITRERRNPRHCRSFMSALLIFYSLQDNSFHLIIFKTVFQDEQGDMP